MSDDPYDLATLCRDVCLELLRKREDWIAAASTSEWFKGSDGGKAESLFNTWANAEDAKFEKVRMVWNALSVCLSFSLADFLPEIHPRTGRGGRWPNNSRREYCC